MNRRTLLGRLAAGAAAVLGAGMVAPKVEAAPETFKIIGGEVGWLDPTGWLSVDGTPGGWGLISAPPTFDALAFLNSVERGIKDGTLDDDMTPADWRWVERDARAGQHWQRVTKDWGRSLSERFDTFDGDDTVMAEMNEQMVARLREIRDARAEEYARGHLQATQRAQSRGAEGLTV